MGRDPGPRGRDPGLRWLRWEGKVGPRGWGSRAQVGGEGPGWATLRGHKSGILWLPLDPGFFVGSGSEKTGL